MWIWTCSLTSPFWTYMRHFRLRMSKTEPLTSLPKLHFHSLPHLYIRMVRSRVEQTFRLSYQCPSRLTVWWYKAIRPVASSSPTVRKRSSIRKLGSNTYSDLNTMFLQVLPNGRSWGLVSVHICSARHREDPNIVVRWGKVWGRETAAAWVIFLLLLVCILGQIRPPPCSWEFSSVKKSQ